MPIPCMPIRLYADLYIDNTPYMVYSNHTPLMVDKEYDMKKYFKNYYG